MRDINSIFHKLAKSAGCCEEWLGKIENATKDELLDIMVKGIDFTANHARWFSNKFAIDTFGYEMLHRHNIYIDEKIPEILSNGIYVFLGSCWGDAIADEFTASTIHCMDMCDIRVVSEDFSKVFINVYHMSRLEAKQDDVSKMYVYKHGSIANVTVYGDILVRESK